MDKPILAFSKEAKLFILEALKVKVDANNYLIYDTPNEQFILDIHLQCIKLDDFVGYVEGLGFITTNIVQLILASDALK